MDGFEYAVIFKPCILHKLPCKQLSFNSFLRIRLKEELLGSTKLWNNFQNELKVSHKWGISAQPFEPYLCGTCSLHVTQVALGSVFHIRNARHMA